MSPAETRFADQAARASVADDPVRKAFATYGLVVDAQRLASERAGAVEILRGLIAEYRHQEMAAQQLHRNYAQAVYADKISAVEEAIRRIGGGQL